VDSPFVIVQYFDVIIRCSLEHLIGVKVSHSHVESEPGVLGLVRSYLVQWNPRGEAICNDICCCDSQTLLTLLRWVLYCRMTAFVITFVNYICHIVSAHVDGFLPRQKVQKYDHPHSYRPPDPRSWYVLQRGPRPARAQPCRDQPIPRMST